MKRVPVTSWFHSFPKVSESEVAFHDVRLRGALLMSWFHSFKSVSESKVSSTMCDSGVSLTSCTEDSGLDRGLDTSDCDSPTAAGKGGHTVTIQVRIQNILPVSYINNRED